MMPGGTRSTSTQPIRCQQQTQIVSPYVVEPQQVNAWQIAQEHRPNPNTQIPSYKQIAREIVRSDQLGSENPQVQSTRTQLREFTDPHFPFADLLNKSMIRRHVEQVTASDSENSPGNFNIGSDSDYSLMYIQERRRGTRSRGEGLKYKLFKIS